MQNVTTTKNEPVAINITDVLSYLGVSGQWYVTEKRGTTYSAICLIWFDMYHKKCNPTYSQVGECPRDHQSPMGLLYPLKQGVDHLFDGGLQSGHIDMVVWMPA